MITALLFDSVMDEEQALGQMFHRFTAIHTDEQLRIIAKQKMLFETEDEQQGQDLNIAVVDVTQSAGLAAARSVREKYPDVQILIIADVKISPMQYLNPSIQPSALLLRPWEEKEGSRIIEDFFLLAVRPLLAEDQRIFWAKTREGVQKIPYAQIWYFEAREKKVFIRTQRMEYGVAGTIEKIQEKLPDCFCRCHRSYIVNTDYIERLQLSDGLIYLPGSVSLPVSRSYKAKIRGYVSDKSSL